jgi:hypothetical protein
MRVEPQLYRAHLMNTLSQHANPIRKFSEVANEYQRFIDQACPFISARSVVPHSIRLMTSEDGSTVPDRM